MLVQTAKYSPEPRAALFKYDIDGLHEIILFRIVIGLLLCWRASAQPAGQTNNRERRPCRDDRQCDRQTLVGRVIRAPLRVGPWSSSMLVDEKTGRKRVGTTSAPARANLRTASIIDPEAQVLVIIQKYSFADMNLNTVVRLRNRGS